MDWDARYAGGDTPWDKGAAHPVLDEALARGSVSGRVLVPGCGTGHDVRALAAQGLEVTGLDIAPLALQRARAHAPAGRERYFLGDLFALPAEWEKNFDSVFEHTCFCAIEPARRPAYVEAVASVLRPGGRFLSVFFLDPGHDADGPPFGCTREEISELFGSRFRVLDQWGEIPTYAGREGRELLMLMERA